MNIAEFLEARIAEDEALARAASQKHPNQGRQTRHAMFSQASITQKALGA